MLVFKGLPLAESGGPVFGRRASSLARVLMARQPALVVVKLGGSHADVPALRAAWLAAIAAASGPVVLVPGGGPFADAVRAQQRPLGYDDATAHDMALLAMAQYGLVLAAAPGFLPAATLAQIARALAAGLVPVWLPAAMLARARGVAKGWAVTSDSLALWLATRLGARAVLLVKRDAASPGLDDAFPGFHARFPGEVRVAGAEHVPQRLDTAALPGRPLPRPDPHAAGQGRARPPAPAPSAEAPGASSITVSGTSSVAPAVPHAVTVPAAA